MCEQSPQKSLDSSNGEPLSKRKCIRFETSRYCWMCFVPIKNPKTCSVLTCEQSFHIRCLSGKDKKNKNEVAWKCPDCQKYEAFGESSSHSKNNINEKLWAVDKHLRDNSTLDKFDSAESPIKEKLNAGKYESGLEFLIDIKKAIIAFFIETNTDEYFRHWAKVLVKECERALAPLEKRCSSNAFAIFDDFASEMKNLHSRLETKLKVATNYGIVSLQNDVKRMQIEFDIDLLKASEEKSILESKLKAASDGLLVENTNYEKLQNENMQLKTEKEAATINSKLLMAENVQLHNDKNLLNEELHKASVQKFELESKLQQQSDNEKLLMAGYDLQLIKASDEKGQLELKLLLIETNFEKLENEKKILMDEVKIVSAEQFKHEKAAMHLQINDLKDRLNAATVELKQITSENDNLLIERIQLQNEKSSGQSEKDRMQTKFDAEWREASNERSHLKSKISMVEKDFENLRDEKKLSDDAKHKLRGELEKVSNERDGLVNDKLQLQNENRSLKLKEDQIILQTDCKTENSISEIQIETMKRQTSAFDADNFRLNLEKMQLEQKIDELKKYIQQINIESAISRIRALEKECDNLKNERDTYRARWKYVKSKQQSHNTSFVEDSE